MRFENHPGQFSAVLTSPQTVLRTLSEPCNFDSSLFCGCHVPTLPSFDTFLIGQAARRVRAAEHRQRQQQELALDFRDRAKGRWDFRKVRRDFGRAETALATIEGEDGPWRDVMRLAGVNRDGGASVLEGDTVLDDEVGVDVTIARKRKRRPGEKSLDEEEEAKHAVEELSDEDRVRILERMLRRLRNKHWYCIYCGVKYDSQEDIDTECPGEDEDLH